MRSDELVLAIDLGTSGPKVALVSTRGEIVARASAHSRLILRERGGAEQDPGEWWSSIVEAVRQVLGPADHARRIGALSCTGQWSGTVPVDESGRPLMNAIICLDARGARQIRRITSGFPSVLGYAALRLARWLWLTGGAPTLSGKDPVAHILHIKEELPEIYRRCHMFLEPKDYLNLVLTGRFRSAADSIALHWVTDNRNLRRVAYDARLLEWTGIDREKLPDLGLSTDVLGPLVPRAAADLGLAPGIPVVMGTPDVHAAALGSGAAREFSAHLSVGTSSWLTCHVPFKKTDPFHNIASLPSANPECYLVLNEQATSGACLKHFVEKVLFANDEIASSGPPADVYARLDAAASRVAPGCDGLIFTPWLYGERTPVEDSTVRGGFHNMSLGATRAHMVRSIMEGVAFNLRWLLGYVEKFAGRSFPAIRMIGGGARSPVWCQVIADVLDRPIGQVGEPTAAGARGAALLALVAMGQLTFGDLEDLVRVSARFEPRQQNRRVYDTLFDAYLQVYERLRPVHAGLNR